MEKYLGPTYEEMLHPRSEMKRSELPDRRLKNISWKNKEGKVSFCILPKAITGVDANIIVLFGRDFPTGSHKVGAAYSILMEKILGGEMNSESNSLLVPSTGNFGIGMSWVGKLLNYETTVLLPVGVSRERFEWIGRTGSKIITTEDEIINYAKKLDLENPGRFKVVNQFTSFANYRFHYHVTGNTMTEIVKSLEIGDKKIAAVVGGIGSGGTLASGDRVKKNFPKARIIAVEPQQCATLTMNGFGNHMIQGISDGLVPWIYNPMNTDAVMAVDDSLVMEMFGSMATGKSGKIFEGIIESKTYDFLSSIFGISGIANVLGAIKTARYYGLGSQDNIITIATDARERYLSLLEEQKNSDKYNISEIEKIHEHFAEAKDVWVTEGTLANRQRWHNLKYYSWVAGGFKTEEELKKLEKKEFWRRQREKVQVVDRMLLERRETGVIHKVIGK